MSNIKIAFFDSKQYDIDSFKNVNNNFNFEIKFFKNHLNIDTVSLTRGFDIVCGFVNDSFTKEIIDNLINNGIKLIALRCAGYNNVDLRYAFEKIHVVRVPAYSPHAVAEHAVALMLTLNRKTHRAYYRIRDNNFTINGLLGFDMYKKTVGVIGAGKIGKALIKILRGFDMNVLVFDNYHDKDFENEVKCKYVDIDTLYKESEIISLNCPLTKETYHMINKETINKMKNGVMLINTGRGQLINTIDLIEALKNKKVGSAGLDVYEEESEYFFEDFSSEIINDDILARLISFNNVLITSHQGFFTKEALNNIAVTTLNNIKDFIDDKPLTNEICYKCDKPECRKNIKGRCFA